MPPHPRCGGIFVTRRNSSSASETVQDRPPQTRQDPLGIPVRCCDNHHMIITSSTIIPTGVEGTSAAHLVIDHWYDETPITVAWSTVPTACTDWVLGDLGSQGPVHQ